MQQHPFGRARLILAVLAFGAAAFLGAQDGWAKPYKAGYPNPPWNPAGDGNTPSNLIGNVRLTRPVPGAPLNVTGTRVLSFADLLNPGGTTYALYLWQDGDPVPGAAVANFTKAGAQPQTFTYTATLTVNDGPNIAGNAAPYNVHRFWNWRVDVTSGGETTTGDVWQFRVPLEAPTNNSTDVSVYCKFEWEASADYTTGVTTEGIYILDPNVASQVTQGWYSGTTTTSPNSALTNKTVALFPKPPLFYGSVYPDYREFWIHDDSYKFQNYPRLQPNTTYQWRIWYTSTNGIPVTNASIQLDLLETIPAGQTATFTIFDPAGNAGAGLTDTFTLTGQLDVDANGTIFYNTVTADVAAQATPGSNISLITVTNATVTGSGSPVVTLTWPVLGTAGNNVTLTIPAASATYLASNPAPVPPATAANFTNGALSKGFYGPIYTFTTVTEAYVDNVDPDATQNYDQAVESLIVYWQHPQGTLARDPEENVTTFLPQAFQLWGIHEIDLQPTSKTVYFGTEQMAASYGGLDEAGIGPNNVQQVYVPDIPAFDGWYSIGGATAVTGAYDTGQYAKRVGPGYPASLAGGTIPTNPEFFSSADNMLFPYATQDRYHEWVAKGIRTWLQDAANGGYNNDMGWLPSNDHASLPHLKQVVLLGDAQRVAPSFYYYYSPWQVAPPQNRWAPTDFFYSTQSLNSQPGASATWATGQPITYTPSYEVSRIPISSAPLITVDQNVAPKTFPPTPSISPYTYTAPDGTQYTGYFDPLPYLSKIRDYCDLLNSYPNDTAKTTAFANWFHQVAMIDGATEYYKWFQFFPAFAQYLLGMQVQDDATSPKRDAFSGMIVRKYDLNGLDAADHASYATTGGEALTLSNILGRLSIDNGYDTNLWNIYTPGNDTTTEVPGFVYLNVRGGTNYGGEDADNQGGVIGETLAGGVLDLTPADQTTAESFTVGVGYSVYAVTSTFDFTQSGVYPNELTLDTSYFPTYIPSSSITAPNPANFPTPTTKARPIVVSPAGVMNRYDNSIWGTNPYTTVGQAAILAQGGPIAIAGFSSGRYEPFVQYGTDTDAQSVILYNGPTDENEGYEFPTITNGTADLTAFSADTDAVIGKLEVCSYIAQQYGLITSPVVGDLFNNALAKYVTAHLDDFVAQDEREMTTVFGATLLGDCAVSMPGREPVQTGDFTRPAATDTSLRPASVVTGYSDQSQYNSQNMPVHVIPHYTTTDTGAVVTLQVQTSAPYFRVRVFTPFEQNDTYVSGEWAGGTGYWDGFTNMTDIAAVPASAGTSIAANELICKTAAGVGTVTFNALIPSVYFVVIQAQSPAWAGATPTDPYRWLQERWFYVQAVNEFVRQTVDSTTGKKINVLLVDMDQHDRYYLDGALYTQHLLTMSQHVGPTVPGNIFVYYWDTMADTFYVDPTQPDGTGINPGLQPDEVSDSPALPYLNYLTSNAYEYQFWCGNVYHSLATNGPLIASSQRYYGEITPEALQSFQATGGVVLWYTGDWNMDFPQGYLFRFDALEAPETGYLTSYVSNGGKLWMDSEDLTSEADGFTITYAGPVQSDNHVRLTEPWSTRTATASPFALTFLHKVLGATPETLSTQYTNVIGDQLDTMTGGTSIGFTKDPQPISDVSDSGGDGRNSLQQASELNPLDITELAATVFTWNINAGTGVTTGSQSSATQNILFTGDVAPLVLSGQTIFFTWPLDSVDHLGDITDNTTGRAYILKSAIDWLAGVPAPLPGPVTNMLPANGATTTTLLPVLSWTAGLDATSYILEYGAGDTLPVSPITVPLTGTSYTIPTDLVAGTTYTWTVISVNANGQTPGPVQTFIAHASTGKGGTTGTGTGTTGTGTTTTGTGTAAGSGGGGGGGGCFIATAGYESPDRRLDGIVETNCIGSYLLTPERLRQLNDIRALRDHLLLHFPAGRAFSAWYYAIGPYGAEAIRDNEPAKAAVRTLVLNPLAELSRECAQAEKK